MGYSTANVPFFTTDIEIGEVEAASTVELFNSKGKTIEDVGAGKPLALSKSDKVPATYILKIGDPRFEFPLPFIEWVAI